MNAKKLISLVLALVMMLALATSAMAATITINHNTPENAGTGTTQPTYTYWVFMKASVSGDSASYYVENEALATALDGLTVGEDDLFTVTKAAGAEQWAVTINKKTDGTAFTGVEVAAALATIKDNAIATGTATAGTEDTSIISIEGDGYVLIESSLGTNLIVDTYTTHTVNEKNEYPTNTKTEDKQNAEIGEVVTYTVNVTIPANVAEKPITVVDTISDGLTLNTAITVSNAGDYTSATFVKDNTAAIEGYAVYTVEIPAATVIANKGKTLTLTYTATVNENAVVNTPEENKAHIEYDNYVTPDVEVEVKTFGFELEKVDKTSREALAGVKFTLTNEAGEYYTPATDATSVDEDRFAAAKQEVATDSDGKITFAGLHAGTYTLTETENPNAGYNMLDSAITITVDAEGTVTAANGYSVQANVLTVENAKGSMLPSTGGMGTTVLYIAGGLLIVAAVIMMATKRRENAAE